LYFVFEALLENPQVLIAEEEKIIVEETKDNQTVVEEKLVGFYNSLTPGLILFKVNYRLTFKYAEQINIMFGNEFIAVIQLFVKQIINCIINFVG